jgi:hypothetical protein
MGQQFLVVWLADTPPKKDSFQPEGPLPPALVVHSPAKKDSVPLFS